MQILNHKNKYIKVQSKYIDDLIANPTNYDTLIVTGKNGCFATTKIESVSAVHVSTGIWTVDLTDPVALNNTIYHLKVKSLASLKQYEVITTPIDLAYVSENCTTSFSECTLQTFSSVLAPLFKTQIDAWFQSVGLTTDVTIEFSGNKLLIRDVPANFAFDTVGYANISTATPEEILFGKVVSTNKMILGDDGIYLPSTFFGDALLTDGVYNIEVKITKSVLAGGGYIDHTGCAFIDISTKCLVAAYIATLVNSKYSENGTDALLLHYGLITGSNCGCNCEDLCATYTALQNLLVPITNSNHPSTEDCGC